MTRPPVTPPDSGAYPAFLAGYLGLLLPTLLFKASHLGVLYKDGLATVLRSAVAQPTAFEQALYAIGFYARDVAEVLVIWGAVFLVGTRLVRLRPVGLAVGAIAVALLVMGGNTLAFAQLGTFMSRETLGISWQWLTDNPRILGRYFKLADLWFFPVAAAWAMLPVLLVRRLRRAGIVSRLLRPLSLATLCGAAIVSVGAVSAVRLIPVDGRLPLWGYWTATAGSLVEWESSAAATPPLLTRAQLEKAYADLAYPAGRAAAPHWMLEVAPARRRPRHIVIVGLETAPRQWYPILDDPQLPALRGLAQHAIVSTRHHTTLVSTTWSNFSMLGGTYPLPRGDFQRYAPCEPAGLASLLAPHGYAATYVDSYRMDWRGGDRDRGIWRNLGFTTLVDSTTLSAGVDVGAYDGAVERERRSLARALVSITDAESRGQKALVFVSTVFGHYDWEFRPGDEHLPAAQKIHRNVEMLDGLIGEFISAIRARGLEDELILVVTGDHGLRTQAEFASLGETLNLGAAAFNVPFLLSAPGLFDRQIELTYATSHVDITPTLLDLVGVPRDGELFHGENLLDARLADRVLLLFQTGLSPADGYLFRGRLYTYNGLTGGREIGRDEGAGSAPDVSAGAGPERELAGEVPAALRDPGAYLERARACLRASARYFADRRKGAVGGR